MVTLGQQEHRIDQHGYWLYMVVINMVIDVIGCSCLVVVDVWPVILGYPWNSSKEMGDVKDSAQVIANEDIYGGMHRLLTQDQVIQVIPSRPKLVKVWNPPRISWHLG